jgi:selenoprotein W-related protein
LKIVPGSGGVFEVEVDGKLVFSKKKTGRFPDYDEIAPALS